MTRQDLINSRSEIIARINEIADTTKAAEIMLAMVRLAENGMNDATDCVDFVDEVVTLLRYEKKYVGEHIDDLMAEASKRQRPSSMR